MEAPPRVAPPVVRAAANVTATAAAADATDGDELPIVLRWAERFFSTWHYPTGAAAAALVIWSVPTRIVPLTLTASPGTEA